MSSDGSPNSQPFMQLCGTRSAASTTDYLGLGGIATPANPFGGSMLLGAGSDAFSAFGTTQNGSAALLSSFPMNVPSIEGPGQNIGYHPAQVPRPPIATGLGNLNNSATFATLASMNTQGHEAFAQNTSSSTELMKLQLLVHSLQNENINLKCQVATLKGRLDQSNLVLNSFMQMSRSPHPPQHPLPSRSSTPLSPKSEPVEIRSSLLAQDIYHPPPRLKLKRVDFPRVTYWTAKQWRDRNKVASGSNSPADDEENMDDMDDMDDPDDNDIIDSDRVGMDSKNDDNKASAAVATSKTREKPIPWLQDRDGAFFDLNKSQKVKKALRAAYELKFKPGTLIPQNVRQLEPYKEWIYDFVSAIVPEANYCADDFKIDKVISMNYNTWKRDNRQEEHAQGQKIRAEQRLVSGNATGTKRKPLSSQSSHPNKRPNTSIPVIQITDTDTPLPDEQAISATEPGNLHPSWPGSLFAATLSDTAAAISPLPSPTPSLTPLSPLQPPLILAPINPSATLPRPQPSPHVLTISIPTAAAAAPPDLTHTTTEPPTVQTGQESEDNTPKTLSPSFTNAELVSGDTSAEPDSEVLTIRTIGIPLVNPLLATFGGVVQKSDSQILGNDPAPIDETQEAQAPPPRKSNKPNKRPGRGIQLPTPSTQANAENVYKYKLLTGEYRGVVLSLEDFRAMVEAARTTPAWQEYEAEARNMKDKGLKFPAVSKNVG